MTTLRPDATQLVSYAKGYTQPIALGQLGHVAALKYSSTEPGGCDQLSATLQVPATVRTSYVDAGRLLRGYRGAGVIWDGVLDEPVPGTGGLGITAHGAGTLGATIAAEYSGTWPSGQPDQVINAAISAGRLRWVNPGIGTPSGIYLGDNPDSASEYIADVLNNATSRGGLTWQVDSRTGKNVLRVFPIPTAVTRVLVAVNPVPRTQLAGTNTIKLRYQSAADNATTGAVAAYAITTVTSAADLALHDPVETYADLSSAGTLTAGQAQAVGNFVLQRYQRFTFAGPFVIQPGQLLNTGGQPVDLGAEIAGEVYRLILTDYGYGGEDTPKPITFVAGQVEYDDEAATLTVTPMGGIRTDFQGLLTNAMAMLPPAAAA